MKEVTAWCRPSLQMSSGRESARAEQPSFIDLVSHPQVSLIGVHADKQATQKPQVRQRVSHNS